jgi:hypothetical protein
MADYSRQIQSAKDSIAKKGMLCQWVQPAATVESATPWKATDAEPTETDVYIVFLPTGRIGKETARALAGKEVQTGDEYGYMASQSFDPAISHFVKKGSKTLRVLAIETLAPAGDPILHILSLAV